MPPPDTKPTTLPTASAIAELIGLGNNLAAPKHREGYEPFVFTPDGKMALLTPAKAKPLDDFIVQSVKFNELDSFTRYLTEYRRHTTRIFVTNNETGAIFVAIFDYHEAGKDGRPQHLRHLATYPCPESAEWQAWKGKNQQPFTQQAFFDFIDEHGRDIAKPDSADLLELARDFSAKSEASFSSKITPKSGAVVLQYTDEIEQGRPDGKGGFIEAPDELTIDLPIFEGGRKYPLVARLRPRAAGGKVQFTYALHRVAETIRQAVRDISADIETATDIKPYFGTPLPR